MCFRKTIMFELNLGHLFPITCALFIMGEGMKSHIWFVKSGSRFFTFSLVIFFWFGVLVYFHA